MPKTKKLYREGEVLGNNCIYIKDVEDESKTKRYSMFKCSCGKEFKAYLAAIINFRQLSCGCYRSRPSKDKGSVTASYYPTPEYSSWRAMKDRCLNIKSKDYNRYGGKGIKICDRWKDSFENFLEDMGKRPSINHSLDRIKVEGNYEPNNCRWATKIEQSENRANHIVIEYKGEIHALNKWAEILKIPFATISSRYHGGIRNPELLFSKTRLSDHSYPNPYTKKK